MNHITIPTQAKPFLARFQEQKTLGAGAERETIPNVDAGVIHDSFMANSAGLMQADETAVDLAKGEENYIQLNDDALKRWSDHVGGEVDSLKAEFAADGTEMRQEEKMGDRTVVTHAQVGQDGSGLDIFQVLTSDEGTEIWAQPLSPSKSYGEYLTVE